MERSFICSSEAFKAVLSDEVFSIKQVGPMSNLDFRLQLIDEYIHNYTLILRKVPQKVVDQARAIHQD